MPISTHTKGQMAIDTALWNFRAPANGLSYNIWTSLQEIQRNYSEIKNHFIRRAEKRILEGQKSKRDKLASARDSLEKAETHLNQLRETHQKDLIPTGENLVKFAQGEIALVESISNSDSSLIKMQNTMDELLWEWYDQLIAGVVDSLEDDARWKIALQFLANSTIMIAGAAASAPIAGLAALLAAVQLSIQTLRDLESHPSGDPAIFRLESGLRLINEGNKLSIAWLGILRP